MNFADRFVELAVVRQLLMQRVQAGTGALMQTHTSERYLDQTY